MPAPLEALFHLQSLDTRLLEKQRVVTRYEADLAARREALAQCDARLGSMAASRKDAVGRRAFGERQIEDLQASLKVKRQRAQKARNEKELRAGQDEIAAALEEIREAEARLLEAMAQVEDFEEQIAAVQAERGEIEHEDHRLVGEAEERIARLREEVAAERGVRDNAAEAVDAGTRRKYDFLLEKRAGLAVVELDAAGCCSGCHVQVPTQTILEVRRSSALRVCPMCQRILYIPADQRA